jgi:long-chain acyl-CoA synthetase
VIGENHKFPAALIVPQFDAVQSWLAAQGESIEDRREMAKHPKVIELIQSEIDHSNSHFGRYSQIKKFALLDEEWTIASGELTPTLKLKRKQILKKHASEITALYEKEELASATYQA